MGVTNFVLNVLWCLNGRILSENSLSRLLKIGKKLINYKAYLHSLKY